MARERGHTLYMIYRALSYGLSPFIRLHLQWRKLRGLEHRTRWRERLGRPSLPRPPGPLVWFHAVSLGEGLAAIPVIKQCIQRSLGVAVLMTTTTTSAFEVIKDRLPSGVIYQYAPLDIPDAVAAFIGYWKPNAIMLMESELWPNLIMIASRNGIKLSLLNARMSVKSFTSWSRPAVLPLTSLLLSKFSLIVPLSMTQALRFQLLQASPFVIHFSGDLKYAVEQSNISEGEMARMDEMHLMLAHRRVWMASSIHEGEEEVILGVHVLLKQMYPDLVTIIVTRYPQHGQKIDLYLQKKGISAGLRSRRDKLMPGTNIYIVDTLGELRHFYRLSPIAVVGGSFFPNCAGHNISEPAGAGCAVLTGKHVGHFSDMVMQMQRVNPISVLQVSGKAELEEALIMLFSDVKLLEARRMAAKQAFHALSTGIVENIWKLLNLYVFEKVLPKHELMRPKTGI